GEAGERLNKAESVLQSITGHKSVQTLSNTTSKEWGLRKRMPIGCKVTLRGENAEKFLKDALWVKDNRIAGYSFDPEGNFSFGVPDYTDLPNMKYDPKIGIFGMDISVSLKRAGFRIAQRKRVQHKLPKKHRITHREGIDFAKKTFNVEVIE
ncbi:MAG: 50S ribosomal protein L5, partial [Thermoplasmata archaeon]|nr:50S ribosomal protein L5 [Thermoplasmata archaeon]